MTTAELRSSRVFSPLWISYIATLTFSGVFGASIASGYLNATLALFLVLLILNVAAAIFAAGRASAAGLLVGGYAVGTQIIGWTASHPRHWLELITVLAAGVLLTYGLNSTMRLREAFVGPAPWLGIYPLVPSIAGAFLQGSSSVVVGRLGGALVLVGVLLTVRRKSTSPERFLWGLSGSVHIGLSVLLLAAIISPVTQVVSSAADSRLSGGTWAFLHPNVIGMLAFLCALPWIGLRDVSRPMRALGIISCAGVIALTQSRTAIGAFVIVVATVLAAQYQQRRRGYGRAVQALGVLVVMSLLAVSALIAGSQFFLQHRAGTQSALSGRQAIWDITIADFKSAPPIAKLLGTTNGGTNARVVFKGETVNGSDKFTSHNAILGLLRISGVAGLVIGIIGLIIVIRLIFFSLRFRGSILTAAVLLGSLATIPVEAFVFGGLIWIWIAVVAQPDRPLGLGPPIWD
jgi:hypothetical protein